MPGIHSDITAAFGNTPLVRLNRLTEGLPATVLAKLEFYNPGSSVKDRLGIDYGETTPDGRFTLIETECLGSCGDSPVCLVNNQRMESFLDNKRIDELIAELKAAS